MSWLSLILILFYWSTSSKEIKRLKTKIQKVKRLQREKYNMSKILSELINRKCIIQADDDFISLDDIECTILDVDDDWLKFTYKNSKGNTQTKIIRIELIESIDLIK